MVEFSIKIKNKYSVKTYEETKKTYDWLCKAIHATRIIKTEKRVCFLFDIGNFTCSCDNIEEFTENAYGQADYNLIEMKIFQIDSDTDQSLFIYVHRDGIRISAKNKKDLETIIGELEKVEEEKNDTYIETQYNFGNINGSNNQIIQGNENTMTISTGAPKKQSKLGQWCEAILQNLLANWLWVIIPAIVAFLIGYFL